LPESDYPFWGTYYKTPIPDIRQAEWISNDSTINGWDWSLPSYVQPSEQAYLCIARNFGLGTNKINQLPAVNFPSTPVISHWVKWRDLEPTEGNINFQPLISNINLASQKGYSSMVRIHFSAIDFAPDWIKAYNIPIREEEKENPKKTNYEVSHPEFHSRYIKFIQALGESGIPQMDIVKGLYLGYASPSNGDEGIGPYGEGNPDANDTVQHVIERIDAWAEACMGVEHKVYMGGLSNYGFSKGFGIRRGFVEMYLYHIPDEHIGQKLDSDDYLYVDETCPVIAKNLFQGEENEEYEEKWATGGSSSRFGDLESFPYRYFTANLRLLQMRTNYLLNNSFSLLPEMLAWVSLEMDRTIDDTPDAWTYLRESYIKYDGGRPVKNFERWLYQRDAPGYETTPALRIQQAIQMWMVQQNMYYDYIARKGKKIGFDVDDQLFPGGEQAMALKVSFYDGVPGTLKLVYENNLGIQQDSVVTNGTDQIRTVTFFINARLEAEDLNFDFELHSEEEVPVAFVRVIKTEPSYVNTDQSPFGGTNRTIPGLIEGEHFDIGGEGFAFHDDTTKEGEMEERPSEMVDIMSKAAASNGYTVSYTNTEEWLEYTVDVSPGNYDISFYYFCGENDPGELKVSLNGVELATFSGMVNQGWETQDTLTIENVFITRGRTQILHLELANGAGFDIDAIEFISAPVDVSGISLSGCRSDLDVGDFHKLSAIISPANADDRSVTWNSSNPLVATVDENGLVSPVSEGSVTISITSNDGGYTDLCAIEITEPVISVFDVSIDNCPFGVHYTGDSIRLSATVFPSDANDKSVIWSSSNSAVATVDTSGLITLHSMGNSIIKVTANDIGYWDQCIVLVDNADVTEINDVKGQSADIRVYPNPTSEKLYVQLPEIKTEKNIQIFNSNGQLLLAENTTNTHVELDTEQFKSEELLLLKIVYGQETALYKLLVGK